MSRRWLLFLFCLVIALTLISPSWASLTFRVNETATTVKFEDHRAVVFLAVENPRSEIQNATLQIELLDPENGVRAKAERIESIAPGNRTFAFELPLPLSKLTDKDRRELIWYRLRYRVSSGAPEGLKAEGVVSLSEITPELFEVRVAAAEMVHEGMRYRARAQAIHPFTRKPSRNVQVQAVLTLETDDAGNGVKLPAAGVTDSEGYAILSFDIPARFPDFPHQLRPAGGSLKVSARRGGFTVDTENSVLVDQFPRVLISTDKPIYQPGQKLHLRALVLSPTRRALANQEVIFRIEDPEETMVFREPARSSRFGIANIDWPIPENARLGDYWVKVALGDGDDSSETVVKVRISRYDLPNFSVKVQPDRSYYLPGQNAEVKVSADYLFGRPVTRGQVRVVREVEREWNYKEQKWDIKEGDKYEGETDARGMFTARVKLSDDFDELTDEDYGRFRDLTYAAYFTDPTTRRTEQRRFDLRISKDSIHVYAFRNDDGYTQNSQLPLRFYVATYYADGTPAACRVSITDDDESDDEPRRRPLATLKTNRYGLGKVSTLRMPDDDDVELRVTARQSNGKQGSTKEDFSLDEDQNELRVETDKSLYRPGEPIVVSLVSNQPDVTAFVDVGQDGVVFDSRSVRLRGGRGTLTIPFRPEFKDKLTVAAYPDFPDSRAMIATRTILYPRDRDLKIEARSRAETYRPGEEAEMSFRIRGPNTSTLAGALGVAITDKAVDERFRTDSEFGNNSYGLNRVLFDMLGYNDQIAGVTFRDLQKLDLSKPVAPDLELVAEVLLNQSRNYYPVFFDGDGYEHDFQGVFRGLINRQLAQVNSALATHYTKSRDYPTSEQSLRDQLSQSGVAFEEARDPWGTRYRPVFSVQGQYDVLSFMTAGADKRFDTNDDFSVEGGRWMYFRAAGAAFDAAVHKYHERTGGFIRDAATLRNELARAQINLDTLTDKWGQPYRIDFEVSRNDFVIKVTSGGPDKKFSRADRYSWDDFVIWTSQVDYFAESRTRMNNALADRLKGTNQFPKNEMEFGAVLQASGFSWADLRDPWGRRYYATFKTQSFYGDTVRIENRGQVGSQTVEQIKIKPALKIATVISVRSPGADGNIGTPDDFDVATFSGALTEQTSDDPKPRSVITPILLSGNGGAITGVVTDPNGASIVGANVTATLSPDSQTRSTLSDQDGSYRFLNLMPGSYELRFEAPGFNPTVVTSVLVRSSSIVQVDVTMNLGGVSETVSVTAGSSNFVMLSSSSVSNTVVRGQSSRSQRINLVTKSGGSAPEFTPRLREYFPETLLWQPSLETDDRGRALLKFKLADNITTWKMSVIGSTEDGELGFVEKEIKAFQPFFVEHDPPKILTEGDEISLPVVVRNYLDRAQPISLEIKPENWFSLLGPAVKRSQVAAGDAKVETFDFRATASVKGGKQRITATASEANDAIEKPVTVHPDGEERSVTASDVISDNGTLTFDIPRSAIPNSMSAELKIYPNLLAHVAEGVEAIMERPYGCGEQTISSTYPSLLLLRHYKHGPPATAGSSDLRGQAERYLRAGYERLLNYRGDSGGFSYWGRGEPDLALTAYALRFLNDARELTTVDNDVIDEAAAWLIKQQRADGSWSAYDYGSSVENKRRSALLTSYVARVLALSAPSNRIDGTAQKASKQVSPELKRALDYLALRIEEIDEPYLIASYALAALDANDPTRAEKATLKLRALALNENGGTYWSLETNTPFYGWGTAGRVETTALAVQALARANSRPEDERLVRTGLLFLLKNKDRYGVWHSTQATINVLDALLALLARDANVAAAFPAPTAEIVANGKSVKTVELPAANRLVTPLTIDLSLFLQTGANRIEIKLTGRSSPATGQVVANFYQPWSESLATQEANWRANGASALRLVTRFDKMTGRVSDEIVCHVEAERVGHRGYGMMLAEIGLPPGADVDRASLETAMKASDGSISQYDVLPDRVVLYLWPRAGGTKFNFKFKPRFGLNAQSAASIVYDYYNPEARAIVAPVRFAVK